MYIGVLERVVALGGSGIAIAMKSCVAQPPRARKRKTTNSNNPQQPPTTNNNQQRPTTTNNNQQQPTTTNNNQQRPTMYIRSMCSSIGGFVNWLQDDVHATQHGCSAYLLDGVAHEWRAARLPPSVPRPGPTTVFILHSPTRCSPQGSLDKLAWYVSDAWLGQHHFDGLVQLRGPRPAEGSAAKAAKAAHGNNLL